jgi:hypothetical protein
MKYSTINPGLRLTKYQHIPQTAIIRSFLSIKWLCNYVSLQRGALCALFDMQTHINQTESFQESSTCSLFGRPQYVKTSPPPQKGIAFWGSFCWVFIRAVSAADTANWWQNNDWVWKRNEWTSHCRGLFWSLGRSGGVACGLTKNRYFVFGPLMCVFLFSWRYRLCSQTGRSRVRYPMRWIFKFT